MFCNDVKKMHGRLLKLFFIFLFLLSSSVVMAQKVGLSEKERVFDEKAWKFLENKFVFWPRFVSACKTPVDVFLAVGASVCAGSGARFVAGRLRIDEEILTKTAFLGALLGSYEISDFVFDKLFDGYVVYRFLSQWRSINRRRTPKTLRGFFEREYYRFCLGTAGYLLHETTRVVSFLRGAIAVHKSGGIIIVE